MVIYILYMFPLNWAKKHGFLYRDVKGAYSSLEKGEEDAKEFMAFVGGNWKEVERTKNSIEWQRDSDSKLCLHAQDENFSIWQMNH